jgi:hypothetical protein
MNKKWNSKEKFLLKQIQYDKENIQVMINLLPSCKTKGEYRTITTVIKDNLKSIKDSKGLIDNYLWEDPIRNEPKLFEVEPSPINIQEHFETMHSFFGKLEDL